MDSQIQFPPNSTGKRLRTYAWTTDAERHHWFRTYAKNWVVSYRAGVSTFRTIGSGANNVNAYTSEVFTIENAALSNVVVAVRSVRLMTDVTILQTSVMGTWETWRLSALPAGGTVLVETPFDSTASASGFTVCRGACSVDGGALSEPIIALGTLLWQQFSHRLHSAVNEFRGEDNNVIPQACADRPILLLPGEAIAVRYSGPNNGWRSTSHGIVKAVYDEITP